MVMLPALWSTDLMQQKSARSMVTLGIVSILLSSVIFAPVSQTATKYLAAEFPVLQIIFFRSLGQTLWMLLLFWPSHGPGMFRSARPGLQAARSALLFVSGMFWVAAVATVPLTTASAINFTAPLMVVIMSVPLLGEKVGPHRWAAVAVGFAGALVVIRPTSGDVPAATFLLLAASFLFACYQILTRKVAASDSAATTSVFTVIVALVVSAVLVPWNYIAPDEGDYLVWVAFFATGLLGGARHYFVVKAYASAPASVISPFFYCELVGVALLGYFVFGDLPDVWTWVGAAIIVVSGLYIAQRERINARADKPVEPAASR